MRASQITPEKVRNIIQGVEAAGRMVESIEIDGVTVNLGKLEGLPEAKVKGLGQRKWSEK